MKTKILLSFFAKLALWCFVSFGLFFVLMRTAESHAPLVMFALGGADASGVTTDELLDAITIWSLGLPSIFLLAKGFSKSLFANDQ